MFLGSLCYSVVYAFKSMLNASPNETSLKTMSPHRKSLEYWDVDELIMEPCCALKARRNNKYFPVTENMTSTLTYALKQRGLNTERSKLVFFWLP